MKERALLGIALAVIAGCAAEAPLTSAIDAKGRTESRTTALVTLARAAPRFSETARDYLYLSPFALNEMGTRRYYLWVGLATTVDRDWLWAEQGTPTALVLHFDGMPVALPLEPWEGLPENLATPAPVHDVRRAQVTLDQLERLATAAAIGVELVGADGARTRFDSWRGRWADWLPFIAGIAPPPGL
jgi:hypothetical protein